MAPAAHPPMAPAARPPMLPAANRHVSPATRLRVPPASYLCVPPASYLHMPPVARRHVPPAANHHVPPAASRRVPPTVGHHRMPQVTSFHAQAASTPVATSQGWVQLATDLVSGIVKTAANRPGITALTGCLVIAVRRIITKRAPSSCTITARSTIVIVKAVTSAIAIAIAIVRTVMGAVVMLAEPVITSCKHKTRHRLDISKDEDGGLYKDDMSWPEHVRLQGDVTGSRFNKTEQSCQLQEVIEKTFVHTAKKMALEDPYFDLDDLSHKSMQQIISDVAAGLDQRSISEWLHLDGKNYGNAIASYVKCRVQSCRSEFKQDVEKVVKVHYQLTSRDTCKVAANGDLTVDTKAPFMHPGILAALELLFVSSCDNCIGFPIISECSSSLSDVDKQEPEIPAPLVAYAASCVCSCLDDFSSGTWSHTSMEASTRMTFRKMLALLQQVKTASAVAYHRLMSKILCEVVPQQKLVIVDPNETAFSVIDLDGLACS
ncbi:hypothetical protein FISHEDRAFT_58468 [Fistulina hepatica ATCC 64428]|uniref:DUF6532 domain-containing protein n=1 Tax=Fistulina hepatica ATCC 64428 TaxID=1128425 RepID=A0A0D7AFE9_9AGAR|nr:hypothetical protein FISHEDRAFT_58468 [Fistulina hepatica ATCC 64428]